VDDQLLRELIDLQKEENQLLKKYLWRLRFSLLSLLLLTTATAIGLGFLVFEEQAKVVPPAPTTSGDTVLWSPAQPTTRVITEDAATFTAPVFQLDLQ
jgi:hypothetical protein